MWIDLTLYSTGGKGQVPVAVNMSLATHFTQLDALDHTAIYFACNDGNSRSSIQVTETPDQIISLMQRSSVE